MQAQIKEYDFDGRLDSEIESNHSELICEYCRQETDMDHKPSFCNGDQVICEDCTKEWECTG